MPNSEQAKPTPQRFVFADALRGVACIAVLLYHMLSHDHSFGPPEPMDAVVRRGLPNWIEAISYFGSNGVPVFFVLSGFVIAYSLRNNPLTRASIGQFILRRQFRLDPPYWAMVVIALGILKMEQLLPVLRGFPDAAALAMPSVKVTLLNLFYLQNLAHVQMILGIAWTLCIEIQFYLVFIVLLWLARRVSRGDDAKRALLSTIIVLGTGALSLGFVMVSGKQSLFIQYWHSFAAGVLCWWALAGRASRRDLGIYLGIFALTIAAFALTGRQSASVSAASLGCALLTASALYLAGVREQLTKWGGGRVTQYLGRISYSLYLVHVPVVTWTLRLGYHWSGENVAMALVWWVTAFALSIAFAHLFFLAVEKPSMALAARFRSKAVAPVEDLPHFVPLPAP